MTRFTRELRIVAPAAALLLLAACSSSNNNKGNANANNAAKPATVAATATAASPTAAATARAAASAAPAASPASASATPARTSSPAAGASPAARPGSPIAGASPTAGGSADDKLLASLALTEADLPPGFSKQDGSSTPPTVPGQTAEYSATFTKLGQGAGGALDVQAIVDFLTAFKDDKTLAAGFKDVQSQITAASGGDFKLEPILNGPKVGDETLAFKVSGSAQGLTLGGYAIVWRRGRFGGSIIQVALAPPQTIDDAAKLAQAQDNKLKTAK